MNNLPEGFDGVFRFTNFTNEDFKAKWGSREYLFPAGKMTPMIISGATPEEVQNIRKKFAKELAEREIYKTDIVKKLDAQNPQHVINSINAAVTYNPKDLEQFITRCLEPLPVAQAYSETLPSGDAVMEQKLRRDNRGRKITRVLEKDESLLAPGSSSLE